MLGDRLWETPSSTGGVCHYEYFIKVRKIYNTDKKEENNHLTLLTNNTYCNSSEQEYFADGFAMYFIENQKMQENLPESYKIYEELMEEINSIEI